MCITKRYAWFQVEGVQTSETVVTSRVKLVGVVAVSSCCNYYNPQVSLLYAGPCLKGSLGHSYVLHIDRLDPSFAASAVVLRERFVMSDLEGLKMAAGIEAA
jgi:hypothetical protein